MEIRWLAIPLVALLIGCAQQPVKIRTETVEVVRPILYCPAPNLEQLNRPDVLPIDKITPTTSPGEVAVLYKATVKLLIDYTDRLEIVLDQYKGINETYDELVEELGLKQNN